MSGHYGVLGPLVSGVGSLLGAVGAIIFAIRGRAHWEPDVEAMPTLPGKIAAVLSAVGISILFYSTRGVFSTMWLEIYAVIMALLTLVALLSYIGLVHWQTFTIEVPSSYTRTRQRNILGGFELRPNAARQRAETEPPPSLKDLLVGLKNDPDKVWTKPSRATLLTVVVFAYVVLIFAASNAVCAAAILLEKIGIE